MTRSLATSPTLTLALLAAFAGSAPAASGPQKYLKNSDDWFAGAEAKRVAANILSYQADLGGWPKNIDTTRAPFTGDRKELKPTFDNDATTDELRFLARVYNATKDETYRKAFEKGLDYILGAQYPTGGWPQFFPPGDKYHRHITFNDNAMVRLMEFLREVYGSDRYAFVDDGRRRAARRAFDRGVECILKCQIKVGDKLTAWCAQHDEKDYSPRPGRSYELVSLSGAESVGIVRLLMSLDDPSPDVVRAVDEAVAWFESAKLTGIRQVVEKDEKSPKGTNKVVVKDPDAPPMWARFYEIGTNRPIFSDRDGVAKHDLAEIGYERRNGYAWLGYWPQKLLEVEYPAWKKKWSDSPKPPAEPAAAADPLAWPAATAQTRPWTRWWWLGSAVDKPNLTRLLEQYRQAGLGGVEICPIYGAKGYEKQFIDFLSPEWMEMLAHTTREGQRLGLGVDMTTGTGWPFGGPGVSADDASARVVLKAYDVAGGASLGEKLPPGKLQALVAVSGEGKQVDLTDRVKDGRLDWAAPPGKWRLYAVVQNGPVQKVKRAAPGGVGNVLDPYSVTKLDRYLAGFDRAFADFHAPMPRAQFHDSFEYYNAQWTDDFFEQFKQRRGYDLRTQLPALFGEGPQDTVARVKCDYRETISDLHLTYLRRWTEWCHKHGCLSRNQAHGGPGNLLDAYAAADIPECEIFGKYSERHMPFMKLSSSAAHLAGRKLASSESFTWLGEHFQVSLAQVKPAADFLFLCGVNHLFFHGIPYSPEGAPWPGWQFYAAVNFGPQGGLWRDLPQFNSYVTRCQSILQAGRPANDVLLYMPFHDVWQSPGDRLLPTFVMPGTWMESQPVHATALTLWERGYGFDEVSERLLADAKVADDTVQLGGNPYRVIVVPKCRFMPPATLKKLVELARQGATVVVQGALPADVPGVGELEKRRGELKEARDAMESQFRKPLSPEAGERGGGEGAESTAALPPHPRPLSPASGERGDRRDTGAEMREARVGKGLFLVGTALEAMLRRAKVSREPVVDEGVRFVRRTHAEGYHYFLVNRGERPVDSWVTLGTPAKSAVLLDPMAEDRAGLAALRPGKDGATQVYLQLQPGESCVLRTFVDKEAQGRPWRYFRAADKPQAVSGVWNVRFIDGGPELPAGFETRELASWTERDDPEAMRFAGTARYTIEFDRPAGDAADWLLDLGRVRESARVSLNGRPIGTLICPPFRLAVGEYLRPGRNTLEVEVTNLPANRVIDLDRRKVNWKYFYDANVASQRQRSGLDASAWPLQDSGLLGPVQLVPVKVLAPTWEKSP